MAGPISSFSVEPMAATGQAISALSASLCSVALDGWCQTRYMPAASSKFAGATQRQVPQSMQLESTKNAPGTFSSRRFRTLAMDPA
jgi:hypothetical protein